MLVYAILFCRQYFDAMSKSIGSIILNFVYRLLSSFFDTKIQFNSHNLQNYEIFRSLLKTTLAVQQEDMYLEISVVLYKLLQIRKRQNPQTNEELCWGY